MKRDTVNTHKRHKEETDRAYDILHETVEGMARLAWASAISEIIAAHYRAMGWLWEYGFKSGDGLAALPTVDDIEEFVVQALVDGRKTSGLRVDRIHMDQEHGALVICLRVGTIFLKPLGA